MKCLPILLSALVAAPGAAQGPPSPSRATPVEIVSGMNRFGFEMFAKLATDEGDLAFSPASASTAFGLAYAGARGQTAEEIAATLHYPRLSHFHDRFGELLNSMELKEEGRTLAVNNAFWLHQSTVVHPEYAELINRHYRAALQRVDFRGDKAGAAQAINSWAAARTNNRIQGLIRPENIRRDTRAILVNTVYFKADWAEAFDPKNTTDDTFTLADGRATKLPLMRQQDDFAFAEVDGVKGIALPYKGGEIEMVVLLPSAAQDISALERSLDAVTFDGWVERLQNAGARPVKLTLPKFKLNRRMELVKPLAELGMLTPFTNRSDFSGIKPANNMSPDREEWNFKISDVVQQVFVEVDEKGTEAAAATGIGFVIVTGVQTPVEFRADRPFLFAIRDRRNGAVMFLGRYSGEPGS